MIRLHVNIDHVATVRNARGAPYPDPVAAALLCERAGAQGITAHLREDRRHIRDEDVRRLRRELGTVLNLEMAATDEMIAIAEEIRPEVITLVPERRQERTTEGGLDVARARDWVAKTAELCGRTGMKLSLFIEAKEQDVQLAAELGATQVEFHTGSYCEAKEPGEREACLGRLRAGAHEAHRLGLAVAAGHGLTQDNVGAVAALPHIEEFNIGHALISDAIFVGLAEAVRAFRAAIDGGEARR